MLKTTRIDQLRAIDNVYEAVKELAAVSPMDAEPITVALLGVVLRQTWAQVANKPHSLSDPADIPLKLLQRGVISKGSRERLELAVASGPTAARMECCRGLIVWTAGQAIT